MKRLVYFLALGAWLCSPASAHLLKIDRDIGVLMHIDPADAPIEREQATLFFDIKDRTGKFAAERCDCRLQVIDRGKQIFSDRLSGQGLSASAAFSFPAAGMYLVQVSGAPRQAAFQSFHVAFDVRVERGDPGFSWSAVLLRFWPLWAVLALVIAGCVAVLARNRREDR